MVNTTIAQALLHSSHCIIPDFLNAETIQLLRGDSLLLESAKRFMPAGTGKDDGLTRNKKTRGDSIAWLDENHLNEIQTNLYAKLTQLKLALNRQLFLGISSFEGHYARYPKGGLYTRHRDSFQADDSRIVTVILYLNDNWQKSDGGTLRLYTPLPHLDIAPHGGTLVCFLSRELEHEVLETHAPRLSFTGWFKVGKN
jgi:SM-20-related protein